MKPVFPVVVPVFLERYSLETLLAKVETVAIHWKDRIDVRWPLLYVRFLVRTPLPRHAPTRLMPANVSVTPAERVAL